MDIRQVEPIERWVALDGLYLNHALQALAIRVGRPIVVANYVTDLDDVIARKGVRGSPDQLQNPSDWRLFQELTAQADLIITGASYLSEFEHDGERGQNVLTQFDKGASFEDLGDWRVKRDLERNPDIAVLSRSLNFRIPKPILKSGRRLFVFTTHSMRESEAAGALEKAGSLVVAAGNEGVDGAMMMERLGQEGYRVIKMTTGPRILKLLMEAVFGNRNGEAVRTGALDRLYITRVERRITSDDSDAITVLQGQKVDDLASQGGKFTRLERYVQDRVITDDGFETSQEFHVFQRRDVG